MLIEHRGLSPKISETAFVSPTTVICGDVEIGDECRIMFGAVIAAEDAPIRIGQRTVIMDNAVVRSWPGHPVTIGDDVMIAAGAQVNGAAVDDFAFIALGAAIFPGAHVGSHCVVRANAVVHIDTDLPDNHAVPEGWTALGSPAHVVPPGPDERMLFSLNGMNFTEAIFGEGRATVGMRRYLDLFEFHRSDREIE